MGVWKMLLSIAGSMKNDAILHTIVRPLPGKNIYIGGGGGMGVLQIILDPLQGWAKIFQPQSLPHQ